jgi:hypothetical protein
MSDYDQIIALYDRYKAERLRDYRKADEYLMAANELMATADLTEEEEQDIINARS